MTREEKIKLRDQINSEITALERSVATLSELLESEAQSDSIEWFTINESLPSKEINELSLEKSKKKISVLRNVLSRIDTPEYGICSRCKKPIPFERLRAVPSTTRCISCG